MTDTDKLAEYEGIIRMLTTKLEELAAENERLRSEGGAHAALRDVFLNRDMPEALRVRAATAALPHEVPRLQSVPPALDLPCEEIEPLAVVVERQRARQNALQGRDIEVTSSGVVRILPKPGSNSGNGDDSSD